MRVLLSAYACEPDKGSEAGVGWNWAKLISKKHDTWVITRKNNRPSIEHELARNPNSRIHFEYVDLPTWLSFWKKGPKWVRTYYYLWQFAALGRALRLDRKIRFDCGHHVTFVNNWLWTFFALTSIPYIWGPIGSNSPIPKEYLPSWKDLIRDRVGALFRICMRLTDPLYWLSCVRARIVVVINRQSQKIVPLRWINGQKTRIEPAIGVEEIKPSYCQRDGDPFSILFVGRFIPIKQPNLALDAFAEIAPRISWACLTLLGQGPQEKNLRDKVRRYGISDQVRFISWLPRKEAISLIQKCDVLLFPSMEGGGMVVLEAMAAGKPAVVLDYGGPGEFVNSECGIKVPLTHPAQSVRDLSHALHILANQPELRQRLAEGARRRIADFSWEKKVEFIDKIYSEIGNR